MPKRFFGRKVEVEDGNDASEELGVTEQETVELEPVLEADSEDETLELDPAESDKDTEQPDNGSDETTVLINELQARAEENRDRYLRAAAELENVQKRHAKERSELLRYAGEQLAHDLVEVVDDMERAAAQEASVSSEELLRGIQLIRDRFLGTLERHGIKSEDVLGKTFDPNVHEALASIPSEEHQEGTIIEQFKKPYFFKDKLMRVAQVVVAVAPQEPSENIEDAEAEALASKDEDQGE